MILKPQTYPMARRTFGTARVKDFYSHVFGYTETHKKVAAGTATAILTATAAAKGTQTTLLEGFNQPDVPRVLSVTPGGTTADVLDSVVEVFGTNIAGKPMSEKFRFAAAASTVTNGTRAFRTITKIVIDGQASTAVTFTVGTRNVIGINHKLFKNNTTVKVYSFTAIGTGGRPTGMTLQGQPTVTISGDQLSLNTVAPATTPDGTTFLIIAYTYDDWSVAPFQDQPEYSTSTSTSSTSSSTSTTITTSTSTSSTSSSTSSTSSSTSSTSSSTSSTSTSTTTVP